MVCCPINLIVIFFCLIGKCYEIYAAGRLWSVVDHVNLFVIDQLHQTMLI